MTPLNPFDNKYYLCLAGGGPKGHIYTGALKAINYVAPDFLPGLKGVVGTSVGSFFALLLACRTPVQDIANYVDNINFLDLVNISIDFTQYGLDNGRLMRSFAERTLVHFLGSSTITFQDLYLRTGIRLVIVVTNVDLGQAEYHGKTDATWNLPILDSLLASCSIPIIFSPITIQKHYYVDGGLTDNFAFQTFNMQQTLGMRFMGRGYKIDGFKSYLYRVVSIPVDKLEDSRYNSLPDIYKSTNIINFIVNDNPELYYNTDPMQLKSIGFEGVYKFIEAHHFLVTSLLGSLVVQLHQCRPDG